eukprot:CAMPEP_0171999838 /NCGR_PEP_ID=MMETSP1041-20130122/1991_1 /TAXON_ID=464988 /ORGANISM="Hemiselmis andersenii, Strain CCMP439" /LENGTH=309 /DNA_ID=CAMNT_0012653321 /DNA_START=28 /DNA_END=958 /DNA_ORIENTATION=-
MNSKAECCAQLHPDKQAMCLRWSARGTAGVCLLPLRAAQCLGARLTAPSANPVSWGPHSFARVEVREADGEAGERLPLARQRDVGPGVRGQDIERVLPGLHALPALANRQVGEVGVQGAQRDLVPRRESPQPQRGLYGSHDGGRHLAEQGAAVLWPVGEDVVPHGAVAFFDPKHCRLGRDVVIVEARGSKGEKEVPWGAQAAFAWKGRSLGLGFCASIISSLHMALAKSLYLTLFGLEPSFFLEQTLNTSSITSSDASTCNPFLRASFICTLSADASGCPSFSSWSPNQSLLLSCHTCCTSPNLFPLLS